MPIRKPALFLKWPRSAADDPSIQLGVDVAKRSKEVEAIVKTYISQAGLPDSLPPEDFLQEVLIVLCRRNHNRCAWDPRRGTFGHYVWMIASNVAAKARRRASQQKRIPHTQIVYLSEPVQSPCGRQRSLEDHLTTTQYYETDMEAALDMKRGIFA